MTQVNTATAEFKIITDKKDEPKYAEVKEFVGGMVETVYRFQMVTYFF
jgi:hypothetical protein